MIVNNIFNIKIDKLPPEARAENIGGVPVWFWVHFLQSQSIADLNMIKFWLFSLKFLEKQVFGP